MPTSGDADGVDSYFLSSLSSFFIMFLGAFNLLIFSLISSTSSSLEEMSPSYSLINFIFSLKINSV